MTDLAQCPQAQSADGFTSSIGDRPYLPLRVGAGTLDADLVNEILGRQSLDRPVQPTDGDVAPQAHVLLFGEQPQLMAVHGPRAFSAARMKIRMDDIRLLLHEYSLIVRLRHAHTGMTRLRQRPTGGDGRQRGELLPVQRRSPDQATVDVVLGNDVADIFRVHRAAVEHPDSFGYLR